MVFCAGGKLRFHAGSFLLWTVPCFYPVIDVLRETSISKPYILENHIRQVVTKPTRNDVKSIDHINTTLDSISVTDILSCDEISAMWLRCPLCNHKTSYKPSYKFVRYEKNVDDVAFVSDAEKLALNIVYAVDDS